MPFRFARHPRNRNELKDLFRSSSAQTHVDSSIPRPPSAKRAVVGHPSVTTSSSHVDDADESVCLQDSSTGVVTEDEASISCPDTSFSGDSGSGSVRRVISTRHHYLFARCYQRSRRPGGTTGTPHQVACPPTANDQGDSSCSSKDSTSEHLFLPKGTRSTRRASFCSTDQQPIEPVRHARRLTCDGATFSVELCDR